MSKYFSIPGVSPGLSGGISNGDTPRRRMADPRERNPLAEEWYANRKPTSHTQSGFEADEFHRFKGDICRVEGQEVDAHTGNVDVWVQRSDETGSGSYKVRFKPGDDPRRLTIAETRRVHE